MIIREGTRVNPKNFSFELNDIPYLGYLKTQEGTKPDPRKVKGIMDLIRNITDTENKEC